MPLNGLCQTHTAQRDKIRGHSFCMIKGNKRTVTERLLANIKTENLDDDINNLTSLMKVKRRPSPYPSASQI